MSRRLKALGIDQLSVAERILLVEEIWDSIVVEAKDLPLPESQEQDLERRLGEYNDNPKAGSSWIDDSARIRSKV